MKGDFSLGKKGGIKRSRAFKGLRQGDSCKDFLPLPAVKERVYGWTDFLFLE